MTNDAERVSDIVARLRRQAEVGLFGVPDDVQIVRYAEAADIIEAQSKALAEAREALKPFVEAFDRRREFYASRYKDGSLGHANFDKMPDEWPMEKMEFTMGDFRRAALVTSTPENPNG